MNLKGFEMELKLNRYFTRTVEHIHRVQRNMLLLVTEHSEALELEPEECRQLMHNVMNHDRSKFSAQQMAGYVDLTEYYYQTKTLKNSAYEYQPKEKAMVDKAVQHHYFNENHHPEGSPIGFDFFQALETACDLQAMAQEFGEGSCRPYFENVWLPKQQANFIHEFSYASAKAWMLMAITCFEKSCDAGFPKG